MSNRKAASAMCEKSWLVGVTRTMAVVREGRERGAMNTLVVRLSFSPLRFSRQSQFRPLSSATTRSAAKIRVLRGKREGCSVCASYATMHKWAKFHPGALILIARFAAAACLYDAHMHFGADACFFATERLITLISTHFSSNIPSHGALYISSILTGNFLAAMYTGFFWMCSK